MDLLSAYADASSDEEHDSAAPSAAAAAAAAAAPAKKAKTKHVASEPAAASSSSSAAAAAASAPAHTVARPAASASSFASSLGPSAVDAAPDVPLDSLSSSFYVNPAHNTLYYNPRVEELYTPLQGPFRPGQGQGGGKGKGGSTALTSSLASQGLVQNHQRGFVEPLHMSNYVFEDNYHSFINRGVALNPTAPRDPDALASTHLVFNSNRSTDAVPRVNQRVLTAAEKEAVRQKRKAAAEDPSDVESWQGPWATRETDADLALRTVEGRVLTEEQKAEAERVRGLKKHKKAASTAAAAAGEGPDAEAARAELDAAQIALESTTFHGTDERDYQGRTYMSPPTSLHVPAAGDLKCFLPKRLLHTFTGHSKGVNAIKFFPTTGHLLLSASNDKTVKLWNVVGSAHGGYKCLRTFSGHSEAVRGVDFNHDGSRFVTCSYDKYVKVWDTETGQCVSRHSTGKVPFCARIHPTPSQSNEILVGQQNKLVVSWDVRSNEVTQTYNEHLGPVNSVTFIDENRRFVSSSDDKKLLVWEYGIPVVIKHLAEPDMHSMPYVAVHPSGKFFVGQSQDNQILCFTALNKYKLKRDKRFIGHLTAGYACEIGFSPDGSYIMSGDAQGRVLFWDWKTSKVFKKLKCHDQVTIGCQWNPLETSKMATCSWDGTIKYWD